VPEWCRWIARRGVILAGREVSFWWFVLTCGFPVGGVH
jgi:hypothetical protein